MSFYFIANVYITLTKTRNLFASITFCSETTVVTGVGTVSPSSTLDRVYDLIASNKYYCYHRSPGFIISRSNSVRYCLNYNIKRGEDILIKLRY